MIAATAAPFRPRHRPAVGRFRSTGWALGIIGLLLASSFTVSGSSTIPATSSVLKAFDAHISHIVFVMLENHAFDSYFGTYCPATSKYCRAIADGIPPGTCVPMNPSQPSAGCLRPFDFTVAQLGPPTMAHTWDSTHQAVDNGAMDGFYAAEGSTPETFGHYNGTTIPVYWDLAEEYGLADTFFSSAASHSLPNHWYDVAGAAPQVAFPYVPGDSPPTIQHQYLNEANATPSLEDQLINSTSVSWKYYDWALPTYAKALQGSGGAYGLAYDMWNPLAARAQSYQAGVKSHFVAEPSFVSDAQNGTLPNLSWVIPPVLYSDHPPYNITAGQTWVAQLIDSVESSPEWNSTVVFVSWDEYGGFYDHVAPPVLDAYGDGIRVPLLAIGPWVRQGAIDHVSMDFDSVLHLMEQRFGFTCTGTRDCNATLPMAFFDFNRSARAPILIPGYANATYPMPLQSSGKLPPFNRSGVPTLPYAPQPPLDASAVAAVEDG